MNLSADYFRIAREEEKSDQPEAALLHYISSLLSGLCSGRVVLSSYRENPAPSEEAASVGRTAFILCSFIWGLL